MSENLTGQLQPGQQFGRYRILRFLGQGGMGTVYAAERQDDGRTVALKVLAENLGSDEDRARFLREGELASRIDHPNCVYVFRTEEVDGLPTIAMELVSNGTLEEKVERIGPLPVVEAIDDILQIIAGLRAAQQIGILHRDVKPANCFLGEHGDAKIGDFGLSRPVGGGDDMRLTATGLVLATPAFAPPEQLLGEPLDVRADIYSVGATLYYMLTGVLPFSGAHPMAVLSAVLQGTPKPPSAHRPELSLAIDRLVLQCMARDREARFASYDALEAALDQERQAGALQPASLAARMVAFALDAAIVLGGGLPVSALLARAGVPTEESSGVDLAIVLAGMLLVKGLPLRRWGRSPGQQLVGIRVVDAHSGGVPSWRTLLVRTVGIVAVLNADTLFAMVTGIAVTANWEVLFTVIPLLLLLSTARRTNGYACVHDFAAGSRVVVRTVSTIARDLGSTVVLEKRPVAPAHTSETVGEFTIGVPRFVAVDNSVVYSATDRVMQRAVWFHRVVTGTPERPASRRATARSTRIRWIFGERSVNHAWDVYAAPSGAWLADQPSAASWTECRRWLIALVRELRAMQAEGDPTALSEDAVWITDDRRIMLIDLAISGNDALFPALESPGAYLAAVARRALWLSPKPQAELPPDLARRVRSLLLALPRLTDLDEIEKVLASSYEGPLRLTRRRRMQAMALAGAPMGAVFMLVLATIASDARRESPDSDRALAETIALLSRDQQRRSSHPLSESVRLSVTLKAKSPEVREVAAIYLVTHHRQLLRDNVARRARLGDSLPWLSVDSVLQALPTVAPSDSARAARIVASDWKNGAPARSLGLTDAVLMVTLFVLPVGLLTGLCAVVGAGVVRRGLVTRAFDIDVVTGDGVPASRVRLIARAVVTWSPVWALAGYAITMTASGVSIGRLFVWNTQSAVWVIGVTCATATLISYAVRHPGRGLPDHIVGTYTVPS